MAKLKDVQDAQAEEMVKIDIITADIQMLKGKIGNGEQVTMADLDGLLANAKAGTTKLTAADVDANS